MLKRLRVLPLLAVVLGLLAGAIPAAADTTAQSLPFAQDWTNIGLITANDDWTAVPGIVGYLGDDGTTAATGVDPQTRLQASWSTNVDVIANQTSTGISNGGVAEFHLANPVVALQGSGTADAPNIVLSLDTTGETGITVAYNLRDIDGTTDNAQQQVALQFRIGSTGDFNNVPAGYVADATTGPSLATHVTPVSVTLPPAANDQPLVEVRVITTNAVGNDEWVGVDDISVVGGGEPPPDAAPSVVATSPTNGAGEVPANSDVTVTFSESVSVSTATFTISCTTSGAHTFALSGAATTYTLNPDSDFASGETCTVTVDDQGVSDTDTIDPPDKMAADHVFSFTTTLPVTQIGQVQGASHLSPFNGQLVKVEGVVIAERFSNVWIQDTTPDADPATSEAILIFGSSVANAVAVGDLVQVSGTVTEFRPGCPCPPTSSAFNNLTVTELAAPGLGVTKLSTSPLPAATVIGIGGRTPPTTVIEDDTSPPDNNVETSGVFDPNQDGIDFYETLESMLVQVNNPVAVGLRSPFGEIFVLGDDGAGATVRTVRGGVVISEDDFNPERIMLDDLFTGSAGMPVVNVGDHLVDADDDSTTWVVGVMTYDFAYFKIAVMSALEAVDEGLQREVTRAPIDQEIVVGTYNVENLDPSDGSFGRHADLIVNHLRSPDVIAIEEIQDSNGAVNDSVTDASVTWNTLIAAIQAEGGPVYEYRQIDPVDDQDGGEPGGNIRVGFLFRTDRGVSFIDRPGGGSTTPTTVINHPSGPRLSSSPGRIDPQNTAWSTSRKPLAGEFRMHGKKVFVIVNHFNSKGGDQPLFGRFQPPTRSSEVQRHKQAQVENDFVDQILAADPNANVIVLGDINDFEFSDTVDILEGDVLTSLMNTLPKAERYSYVFEGNSQVLDQILVSDNLLGNFPIDYDPVHVNSEFADQASDHDPQVARFDLRGRPVP